MVSGSRRGRDIRVSENGYEVAADERRAVRAVASPGEEHIASVSMDTTDMTQLGDGK